MKRLMIGLPLAALFSLCAVQAALAWPDDAQASLTTSPAGTTAGGTWTVDVSFVTEGHILRVDNLHPTVVIKNVLTGQRQTFQTQPTAESGVWRANVVFPSEGSWTYSVVVGGSGITFDYPPVSIGPAAGAAAPAPADAATGPGAVPTVIALLAAAAAAAAGGLLLARRSMRGRATAAMEHSASADRR
jgi:hypothetical protein